MQIPAELLSVCSARIEERDGSFVVEIPEREVRLGDLETNETYRVALLPAPEVGSRSADRDRRSGRESSSGDGSPPPVEDGDRLAVEIEDVGDQGDGIARIGPGYIVFVPGTDPGDEVTVEITDVRESFAFAEVVDAA